MTKQAQAHVTLSVAAQKLLSLDVSQRRHMEACGVLIGSMDNQGNWYIEQAHPLRNTYESSVYFEFAPEDLLDAELRYPGRIVGVYHSHPTGYAKASNTDRENMQRVNSEQGIPWVWLIIRGPFEGRAHTIGPDGWLASSIVAYHHYDQQGLCLVNIVLESITPATKDASSHKA
jgi:proteasome lid subunit RPN8/RPN11